MRLGLARETDGSFPLQSPRKCLLPAGVKFVRPPALAPLGVISMLREGRICVPLGHQVRGAEQRRTPGKCQWKVGGGAR